MRYSRAGVAEPAWAEPAAGQWNGRRMRQRAKPARRRRENCGAKRFGSWATPNRYDQMLISYCISEWRSTPCVSPAAPCGNSPLFPGLAAATGAGAAARASTVAVMQGNDRRKNIGRSAGSDRRSDRPGAAGEEVRGHQANFVSTTNQLAATHANAIHGILDYLEPRFKGRVMVAEASAGDTMAGGSRSSASGRCQRAQAAESRSGGPEPRSPVCHSTADRLRPARQAGTAGRAADGPGRFRHLRRAAENAQHVVATLW